jgi:hypothetical protein
MVVSKGEKVVTERKSSNIAVALTTIAITPTHRPLADSRRQPITDTGHSGQNADEIQASDKASDFHMLASTTQRPREGVFRCSASRTFWNQTAVQGMRVWCVSSVDERALLIDSQSGAG